MVKPLTKNANLIDRIKREGEPGGSPFLILNLAITVLNNRVHLSERLSQVTVNENRKLLVLEGTRRIYFV